MELVRKEDIVRYATMKKVVNIQKTKNILLGNLLKDMNTLMEVWKIWRPLTMDIFGRCVIVYVG